MNKLEGHCGRFEWEEPATDQNISTKKLDKEWLFRFSTDPYENLWYAIIYRATMDLDVKSQRESSIRFLSMFKLGNKILKMKGVSQLEIDNANYTARL